MQERQLKIRDSNCRRLVVVSGRNHTWPINIHTVIINTPWRWTMFDSLEEQMKHDDQAASTNKERFLLWAAIAVVSILVFGGVYYGFQA